MIRFDHHCDYLGGKFFPKGRPETTALPKFRPANNAAGKRIAPDRVTD
jgi:hypothetical protein